MISLTIDGPSVRHPKGIMGAKKIKQNIIKILAKLKKKEKKNTDTSGGTESKKV